MQSTEYTDAFCLKGLALKQRLHLYACSLAPTLFHVVVYTASFPVITKPIISSHCFEVETFCVWFFYLIDHIDL